MEITLPSSVSRSAELDAWLTYRRNFVSFQVSVKFDAPIELSSLRTSTSDDSFVSHLQVEFETFTHPRGVPIELVRFGSRSSRAISNAVPVRPQRLSRDRPSDSSSSEPASSPVVSFSTEFSRVQFRSSTANHPNRTTSRSLLSETMSDPFFRSRVTLSALDNHGGQVRLGHVSSENLVVRGRSRASFERSTKNNSSSFADRKKKANGAGKEKRSKLSK